MAGNGGRRVRTRAIEHHLRHMERRNLRPSTIRKRRDVLYRLERFLDRYDMPMMKADLDLLRIFVDRPTQGPGARATEISHLRAFFSWALEEGRIRHDPTVRLERPRLKRGHPRPIPDTDLARALDQAPDPRIRPWLYLAAYAGLRACDIAMLTAEELLLDAEPAIVSFETKGGHTRTVPVSPIVAAALLRARLPRHGYLWPHSQRSGPVLPHTVSHQCNDYLHDLGIEHSLHSLRHWFGTNTYRISKNLALVQQLMGHASPTTTRLYTYIDPGEGVAVVNQLPIL